MAAGQKVLVVDDDRMNVAVLKGVLDRLGFAVISAGNGPEAREAASAHVPDLILLDVMMPGETGFQTCSLLKMDPATADIPVIFITCLADEGSKMDGLGAGAVDYISKPFNIREVEAKVRNQLRSREAQTTLIKAQAGRLAQVRAAQQQMLVSPNQIPKAAFGVGFMPVLEAGGDFYDVFELPDGRMGYFVADVSGHDLTASFITSSLKALVRRELPQTDSPVRLMETINSVLRSITESKQYLTAWLSVLDREKGRLISVCAGHPSAILVPVEGEPRFLDSAGDILGFFPTVRVGEVEVDTRPGDRVFLYTDGLVERFQGERRTRGPALERLRRECGRFRDQGIGRAVPLILAAMGQDLPPPEDDVILLGFEV